MATRSWETSRAYPGVKWCTSAKGRIFYVTFRHRGRFIWEKVGGEWEGYCLKDAATIRANRIKATRHGDELPQDRKNIPTLQKVWPDFLVWSKANKKTWKDDEIRYRLHLKPTLGNLQLDQITLLDIERVKRNLRNAGRSEATVLLVMALLRGIFNQSKKLYPSIASIANPVSSAKKPKVDNARERFLNREELDLLFSALKKVSLHAYEAAVFAFNTGARRSEVFGLRWSDVNLSAGYVVFRTTKNGETRRVPLNRDALNILKGGTGSKSANLVFSTGQGNLLTYTPCIIRRVMDRLFNRDLAHDDRRHRVVFHTLRHSFASHLVMNGIPLATVSRLMGHKSMRMVERYSHLAPGHLSDAVSSLVLANPAVNPLTVYAQSA